MSQLACALRRHAEAHKVPPKGHSQHASNLSKLATILSDQYDITGKLQDLSDAITFDQEALSLRPHGHPDRADSLNNLAADLGSRFKAQGNVQDLSNAVALYKEVALPPPGSLNLLILALYSRYETEGNADDLSDVVALCKKDLSLNLPGELGFNTLALALQSRYSAKGDAQDLSDAITFRRKALSLHPHRHPNHASSLHELAFLLNSRHEAESNVQDLSDAVGFHREALSLRSQGHTDRAFSLTALAVSLSDRYDAEGNTQDLSESIDLSQEALTLRPAGDPGYISSLKSLASAFKSRYKAEGNAQDLSNAIKYHQEALAFLPQSQITSSRLRLHDDGLPRLPSDAIDIFSLFEDIGPQITDVSESPVNISGGYGDVYIGMYGTVQVALKRPRLPLEWKNEPLFSWFLKEADTWRCLVHPHVLRFLGIGEIKGWIYLISPYIVGGTLSQYVQSHPDADRPRLLRETADAVRFLHQNQIIHGDIKGNNILVSNTCGALLCDFGLAKGIESMTARSMKGAGSTRWRSPEIIEGATRSVRSDIYALGITIIEILTRQVPFIEYSTSDAVMWAVIRGSRPTRPKGLNAIYSRLWDTADRCCAAKPEERPSTETVYWLME